MLLSVIIVNYNVKYFLEKCLRSVQKASAKIPTEVIVIDNASSDDSISYLQPRFPSVKFIRNIVNTGFGKANNQALQLSSGDFVLFLNPDTIIPEEAFEKCIGFLEENEKAGACGVRMIDGSGKYLPESKRGFPSLLTAFFKLSGITARFPRSKTLARYYIGHLPETETNEVDVLAGAFLMAKKKVLDITGGFDEAFFMYGEDIDLSYRIQKAGWKNFYFAETTIIHFKGESTKKGNLDYVHMFYKAMRIFVKKHYGGNGSGFSFFISLAIRLRAVPAAVKILFKRRPVFSLPGVLHTAIIGGQEEAEKIKGILSKVSPPRNYTSFPSLPDYNSLSTFNEIIFSEAASYSSMIKAMQEIQAMVMFRFYDPQSDVIIGSDSKNKSGMVIV